MSKRIGKKNNNYQQYFLAVVFIAVCFKPTAWAQSEAQERGANALEKQLQRAQYLQELEYQADVLERQVRIAKAQENIDRTIGLDMHTSENLHDVQLKFQDKNSATQTALPEILTLSDSVVTFVFQNGTKGDFKPGDELPTGHRLLSVSMIHGALLEINDKKIRINYRWK